MSLKNGVVSDVCVGFEVYETVAKEFDIIVDGITYSVKVIEGPITYVSVFNVNDHLVAEASIDHDSENISVDFYDIILVDRVSYNYYEYNNYHAIASWMVSVHPVCG